MPQSDPQNAPDRPNSAIDSLGNHEPSLAYQGIQQSSGKLPASQRTRATTPRQRDHREDAGFRFWYH